MIDEVGESSGARCSISVSNGSYVERSCVVRSAGEIWEKSTHPETRSTCHRIPQRTLLQQHLPPAHLMFLPASPQTSGARLLLKVIFSEIMQIMTSAMLDHGQEVGVQLQEALAWPCCEQQAFESYRFGKIRTNVISNPDAGDNHDQRASFPSIFAGSSSATGPGICGNGSSFQFRS